MLLNMELYHLNMEDTIQYIRDSGLFPWKDEAGKQYFLNHVLLRCQRSNIPSLLAWITSVEGWVDHAEELFQALVCSDDHQSLTIRHGRTIVRGVKQQNIANCVYIAATFVGFSMVRIILEEQELCTEDIVRLFFQPPVGVPGVTQPQQNSLLFEIDFMLQLGPCDKRHDFWRNVLSYDILQPWIHIENNNRSTCIHLLRFVSDCISAKFETINTDGLLCIDNARLCKAMIVYTKKLLQKVDNDVFLHTCALSFVQRSIVFGPNKTSLEKLTSIANVLHDN
jgi:hypothetical protein